MIHVTDGAKELLESVHEEMHEHPPGQVLRLEATQDRRLGFTVGDPRNDDQVVDRAGSDLLHISLPLSSELDGAVIDRIETPEGPRFGFSMDQPSEGADGHV
jgi:hypothetical protein